MIQIIFDYVKFVTSYVTFLCPVSWLNWFLLCCRIFRNESRLCRTCSRLSVVQRASSDERACLFRQPYKTRLTSCTGDGNSCKFNCCRGNTPCKRLTLVLTCPRYKDYRVSKRLELRSLFCRERYQLSTVKPVLSGPHIKRTPSFEWTLAWVPKCSSYIYCKINLPSTDTDIKPFCCTKPTISGHFKGFLLLKLLLLKLQLRLLNHCSTISFQS